jgi:hypothetical protein
MNSLLTSLKELKTYCSKQLKKAKKENPKILLGATIFTTLSYLGTCYFSNGFLVFIFILLTVLLGLTTILGIYLTFSSLCNELTQFDFDLESELFKDESGFNISSIKSYPAMLNIILSIDSFTICYKKEHQEIKEVLKKIKSIQEKMIYNESVISNNEWLSLPSKIKEKILINQNEIKTELEKAILTMHQKSLFDNSNFQVFFEYEEKEKIRLIQTYFETQNEDAIIEKIEKQAKEKIAANNQPLELEEKKLNTKALSL